MNAMKPVPACVCVVITLLLGGRLSRAASAQSTGMVVVAVTEESSTTLTDAYIEFRSSRGYSLGSGLQRFGGLYATDAVVPPEGVRLKPALLRWKSIRQVDFLDWRLEVGPKQYRAKARVNSSDGSVREVFLWNPKRRDEYEALTSGVIKITGKLSIEGKAQDVEIWGFGLRSLEITSTE